MGFVILFAFVGVFTYVNLHLTEALGVTPDALGLVYLVFLPALLTTPYAARTVSRLGPRRTFEISGAVVVFGLLLTLMPALWLVLVGLAVFGAGTFFMQAAATGFVGRTATGDRAAANGMYLSSYYLGGLAGAFLLGQIHAVASWTGVVFAVILLMAAMAPFTKSLARPGPEVVPNRLKPTVH